MISSGCLLVLFGSLSLSAVDPAPAATVLADVSSKATEIRLKMDNVSRIELSRDAGGHWLYRITDGDGRVLTETAEQFSQRLYDEYAGRSWLHRLFNISGAAGIAWVVFGFLGQIIFTGRMVVQWLVSEKHKRSTVPVIFWYMSLLGGMMLLIYFLWRRDIVGVSGQATGVLIYLRNLVLIHRHRTSLANT